MREIAFLSDCIKNKIIKEIEYEFPDYDDLRLENIIIPYGFVSSCWHNDCSPSIINSARGIKIYIDYKDINRREIFNEYRFAIYTYCVEDDQYYCDCETNDWNDVVDKLDREYIDRKIMI